MERRQRSYTSSTRYRFLVLKKTFTKLGSIRCSEVNSEGLSMGTAGFFLEQFVRAIFFLNFERGWKEAGAGVVNLLTLPNFSF